MGHVFALPNVLAFFVDYKFEYFYFVLVLNKRGGRFQENCLVVGTFKGCEL